MLKTIKLLYVKSYAESVPTMKLNFSERLFIDDISV